MFEADHHKGFGLGQRALDVVVAKEFGVCTTRHELYSARRQPPAVLDSRSSVSLEVHVCADPTPINALTAVHDLVET